MKRIIVNVSGLTIEEKQRVNEALAKITGATKLPLINSRAGWLFAPASSGKMMVTWSFPSETKTPTHTPQQALEMAGMTPAAEHIILADTLIITDSSGNIVYDSTPDSLNNFIKQRANGVSVKLNKNGAAVMVEKRKVRADFDPTKEYSVDVSGCTEEEKKQVQQAFFDVGLQWSRMLTYEDYQHLDAMLYTNTSSGGTITQNLLMSSNTGGYNMSPAEFLELVYEPKQQGHVHADLMAQYAEDAKTTDKPWELWELQHANRTEWITMKETQQFHSFSTYRRKQKTHTVHGVEVPDLRFEPKEGDRYYLPEASSNHLYSNTHFIETSDYHEHRKNQRLCYEYTEAGKQAAILHAKIMLGVQP